MTYRVGHHSTSDDASRYRGLEEPEQWKLKFSPITRLRKYLESQSLWSESKEQELVKTARANVLESLKRAEKEKKPKISHLFSDVYDELTPQLKEQQQELNEHLRQYPDFYPIEDYESE